MSITRRLFLGSAAAATGAAAATVSIPAKADSIAPVPTTVPSSPDAEIFDLIRQLEAAEIAIDTAERDLEWLIDEWRHLWPLAPEEILGAANAGRYADPVEIETDIAGRRLVRDTASLTKRMSREGRQNTPRICFYLIKPDDFRERLDMWRSKTATGRTERALARNKAWRAECMAKAERGLALAEQYEAETARIREASGVDRAKAHISQAKAKRDEIENAIFAFPVATFEGLEAKADVALRNYRVRAMRDAGGPFALTGGFADDIKRIAGGTS